MMRLTHVGGPTVLIELDGWRILTYPRSTHPDVYNIGSVDIAELDLTSRTPRTGARHEVRARWRRP